MIKKMEKFVCLRMDKDLYAQLLLIADEENKSCSQIIREILDGKLKIKEIK